MASGFYDNGLTLVENGALNTGSFKAELNTSSYVFSKAHKFRADVNASEVSGTGYTAGGVTDAVTVTVDTVNHRLVVTFADASWPSSTIANGEFLIIYQVIGSAATDLLLCCIDAGAAASSSNGTFLFRLTTGAIIQN